MSRAGLAQIRRCRPERIVGCGDGRIGALELSSTYNHPSEPACGNPSRGRHARDGATAAPLPRSGWHARSRHDWRAAARVRGLLGCGHSWLAWRPFAAAPEGRDREDDVSSTVEALLSEGDRDGAIRALHAATVAGAHVPPTLQRAVLDAVRGGPPGGPRTLDTSALALLLDATTRGASPELRLPDLLDLLDIAEPPADLPRPAIQARVAGEEGEAVSTTPEAIATILRAVTRANRAWGGTQPASSSLALLAEALRHMRALTLRPLDSLCVPPFLAATRLRPDSATRHLVWSHLALEVPHILRAADEGPDDGGGERTAGPADFLGCLQGLAHLGGTADVRVVLALSVAALGLPSCLARNGEGGAREVALASRESSWAALLGLLRLRTAPSPEASSSLEQASSRFGARLQGPSALPSLPRPSPGTPPPPDLSGGAATAMHAVLERLGSRSLADVSARGRVLDLLDALPPAQQESLAWLAAEVAFLAHARAAARGAVGRRASAQLWDESGEESTREAGHAGSGAPCPAHTVAGVVGAWAALGCGGAVPGPLWSAVEGWVAREGGRGDARGVVAVLGAMERAGRSPTALGLVATEEHLARLAVDAPPPSPASCVGALALVHAWGRLRHVPSPGAFEGLRRVVEGLGQAGSGRGDHPGPSVRDLALALWALRALGAPPALARSLAACVDAAVGVRGKGVALGLSAGDVRDLLWASQAERARGPLPQAAVPSVTRAVPGDPEGTGGEEGSAPGQSLLAPGTVMAVAASLARAGGLSQSSPDVVAEVLEGLVAAGVVVGSDDGGGLSGRLLEQAEVAVDRSLRSLVPKRRNEDDVLAPWTDAYLSICAVMALAGHRPRAPLVADLMHRAGLG